MINHARTLLLNQPGPHYEDVSIPGDVYIPPYAARELPTYMRTVSDILFGSSPDYRGRLYRVAQYMGILHSTEFSAWLTDVDPRLTYDALNSGLIDEETYGQTVVGPEDVVITVRGPWSGSAAVGRVETRWTLRATGPSAVDAVNMVTGSRGTLALPGPAVLPGSGLRVMFGGQAPVAGQVWDLAWRQRPMPDVGSVLMTVDAVGDNTLAGVFTGVEDASRLSADTMSEPWRTFFLLYSRRREFPYRMSGVLLAYIRRSELL